MAASWSFVSSRYCLSSWLMPGTGMTGIWPPGPGTVTCEDAATTDSTARTQILIAASYRRRGQLTADFFHADGKFQEQLLMPGAADELHSDGESVRRESKR